ncbi:2,3-bisphosphoglycerate-independent phosphoglycerate mutase [Nematocida sp. AWRm80]|nr:2,3-bisphosphoglycerate-independent phosphoglycerate mutase [Nematocida sp. AWRm80]
MIIKIMHPSENRRTLAKCCLVVLDGWGFNQKNAINRSEAIKDGIEESNTNCMDTLQNKYYSTLLYAHGTHVGLSSDTMMGNSEIGHLTIGAGRVVLQDSLRIRKAFEDNQVQRIHKQIFSEHKKRVHILGILSDGNIHGHWKDILSLSKIASLYSDHVYIHTISDGRDTRPSVYLNYLNEIIPLLDKNVSIGSVSGRFYSMDRDKREERTQKAFDALMTKLSEVSSQTPPHTQIETYIRQCYSNGITDEFIEPFAIPGAQIDKGDTLITSNFRVDRMKQIYAMLSQHTNIYTMTRVTKEQNTNEILFERPEIAHLLGDVIADNNLSQARIAETEKSAHVTFFFDGGKERVLPNETRIIHPSPKVATYDQAPEMSAAKITASVIDSISSGTDFVLCNYANADMVGHTGNLQATKAAVTFIDQQINQIYQTCQQYNYSLLVTADHGNAELMEDDKGPIKSHTTNPVPLIIVPSKSIPASAISSKITHIKDDQLPEYSLADVAPTVLSLMGIPQPEDMTGLALLQVNMT